MGEAPTRFCPFCEEPFEGLDRCPDHDLPLVPIERLGRCVPPDADAPLAAYDPRFGRGWVALGAALVCVGWLSPWATRGGADGATLTGLGLAVGPALNAWIVPAAACGQLSILLRQRTRRALRAMRVAVPFLSAVVLAAVALTAWRVHAGVAAIEAAGAAVAVAPRWGLWVVVAGAL
ncbi:MAG: hypothetical protein KC543_11915, partial [Myxococcales bacterium]|nr:hypothetical protein [Myxococcales bacterium]